MKTLKRFAFAFALAFTFGIMFTSCGPDGQRDCSNAVAEQCYDGGGVWDYETCECD